MIDFDIMTEGGEWSRLPEAEALATKAGQAAAVVAGVADEDFEISLLLADDARVKDLNRDFRGKDKATNVLSFPAPEPLGNFGPRHLGDIALAYETLAREAEAEAKSFAHHYAHLIVHGVLHLLGYDHEVEKDAQIMEALEVKALATLGIDDPYRDMAA